MWIERGKFVNYRKTYPRDTSRGYKKATNYFFLAVDFFAGAAVFFVVVFALAIKTSMVFFCCFKKIHHASPCIGRNDLFHNLDYA